MTITTPDWRRSCARSTPALRQPQVVVDPIEVDLGAIARISALERRVTLLNKTRGYTQATVSSDTPWVAIFPKTVNLWAGIPADVRIAVHAANLPFRSQQRADITVTLADGATLDLPLLAKVSLWRESLRLGRRAASAALPEAWHAVVAVWQFWGRVTRTIGRPFLRHGWLVWALWFLLSAGLGAATYFIPGVREAVVPAIGLNAQASGEWLVGAVVLPPLSLATAYLALVISSLLGGLLFGATRGAWRSFFR